MDGSSHNEGRVEVCSNGRWGTVCGDGWTEREAALVCSRLGYPTLSKAMVVQCSFDTLYISSQTPQTATLERVVVHCTILHVQAREEMTWNVYS